MPNTTIQACLQNPGNPVQDNVAILEQTNCVKAFYSAELEDLLTQYRRARPELATSELPSLMQFFKDKAQQPFPYHPKPWDEAKHEPILVLHSSGTTSSPKPVTYRNGFVKCLDSPWPEDLGPMNLFNQLQEGEFCYAPVPSFHTGGFLTKTLFPTLFTHCAMIMGPPAASSYPSQNARLAIQIIKQRNVRMIIAPPLILEELARTEGGIETLASLKFITYGGAPLRKSLGDYLCSRGVQPLSIYGSTETGFLPLKSPQNPEDWEYMQVPSDLKTTFDPLDADTGTYELCFKSAGSAAANELRGIHWSLQVDEWRSKDLFTRHPSAPDWWKYVGRKDDILVLGDGTNINPTALEETLQTHPMVSGALMAGENRWPPCVLLETYDEIREGDAEAFRAGLQPAIDELNRLMRADVRVPDDYVLVLGPGSFVRNLKGGVMRSKTVLKHTEEIDGLYPRQRTT
jgi:acyl-coenzyme A synthetase/AMP-(fatty) acid ligase